MRDHRKPFYRTLRGKLQIAVIALAVVVLLPQIIVITQHFDVVKTLKPLWLLGAFLVILLSNVFAALVYILVSPEPIPFGRTVIVQLATGFTNRLLPSGLGGMGLNTFYLSKQLGINKARTATVAAANNFIGFLAFTILFWLVVLFSATKSLSSSKAFSSSSNFKVIAAAIIIILIAGLFPPIRRRLYGWLRDSRATVRLLIKRPARLAAAILVSMAITVCYIGALWLSIHAAGQNISILATFIVFAVGNAAIAASPTPGGIGTTELALAAALSTASINGKYTLTIAVAFRLAAYLVPMLPGFIAFRYLSSRKLI